MPRVSKKFDAEFLLKEIDVTYKHAGVLVHEAVEQRRWSVLYRVVFEHEGQLWEIHYDEPATEMQGDPDRFNGDARVQALLVEPFEKTVVEYRYVEEKA